MAREAIGDGVEQDGATPGDEQFAFALHSIGHGQRIVAIDALGMHRLWVDAQPQASEHAKAHRLAHGLAAHAVKIVHKIKQNRGIAANLSVPQGAKLVHCRKTHRFPHRAATGSSVANVGDHNPRLAIDPFEEGGAGGNVRRAANDGVVGHDAKGREEGVH